MLIYRNHQVSVTSNQVVGREVSRARPVREKCEKCAGGDRVAPRRARFGGRCKRHRRIGLQGWMWTRMRVPRRGASTNTRVPTANPRRAVSFFPLARPNLKPSLTTPSPAPRVPLPAQLRSDAKGRRLSSMLTAGFSLLKSLGKSATKRKRDGDEESPAIPKPTPPRSARACPRPEATPPARPSSPPPCERPRANPPPRPPIPSRPTSATDSRASTRSPGCGGSIVPRVRLRRAPAHPQRRHGRAFLPDVLLLRRRVQVEVESEDEDIRDSLNGGAESRGGESASGERGGVEGRSGRDVSKADDLAASPRERGRLVPRAGRPAIPAPVFGRGFVGRRSTHRATGAAACGERQG